MHTSHADWTQIASNVGDVVTAITAVTVFILVGFKTFSYQWSEGFRAIYHEFWWDDHMQKARRIITYDDEYELVKEDLIYVLKRSHPETFCKYDLVLKDSYQLGQGGKDRIEYIDKFLAKCCQLGFLPSSFILARRRRSIIKLFFDYWLGEVSKRKELLLYIEKEWPAFESFTGHKLKTVTLPVMHEAEKSKACKTD